MSNRSCQPNSLLLEVINLKKYFVQRSGLFSRDQSVVRAVDGVSFTIYRGETLGLVGESGCGKTTTGRTLLRLIEPTSGKAYFYGQDGERIDVFQLGKKALRHFRRQAQIIFQDPYGSLNPRMTVGNIIEEPLKIHKLVQKSEIQDRVTELLRTVGLNPSYARRYSHEFSGGQRQRIGIARALAMQPGLIVADEPVSALDVSIQAQIVNLLQDLQQQLGLSYLFIAHDLSLIKHISHRVAVMYLGQIVEHACKGDLYRNPLHPYTQALLSAVPVANPEVHKRRIILGGDVPNPADPPSGCSFHPRCPVAEETCHHATPLLEEKGPGHWVACHRV